jgi:hypothetical protein
LVVLLLVIPSWRDSIQSWQNVRWGTLASKVLNSHGQTRGILPILSKNGWTKL